MVNTASPGRCLVYSYIQERSGLYTQEYQKRSSAHRRCCGAIFASPYSAQTFGCVMLSSRDFRLDPNRRIAIDGRLLRPARLFIAITNYAVWGPDPSCSAERVCRHP